MIRQFDSVEIETLKYYVYLYSDPRNGEPFYVGKGRGNRAFAHLDDRSETSKVARIREIREAGLDPQIEILAYNLSEDTAFRVEAAAIDLIGFNNLTNQVVGHGARRYGRKHVDDLHAQLGSRPIERFDHECVLIKVSDSFEASHRNDAMALYDATRGTWRLSITNARRAEYALAVHGGVVREVYRIAQWLPAGSTMRADRDPADEPGERFEFVGRIADEDVRTRYRWRSVAHLYKPGAANPIMYVGPRHPASVDSTAAAPGEVVGARLRATDQGNETGSSDVASPNAVIVAARRAYPYYLRRGVYICQPERPFREDAAYLGFYADGEIKPELARIEYAEDAVEFSAAEVDSRAASSFDTVRRTAEAIAAALVDGEVVEGSVHKLFLLTGSDAPATIRLPNAIVNDTVAASGRPWAWTLGQRYVPLERIRGGVSRTSELQAADED